MKKLYEKNELLFSLVWIGIYLTSMGICDTLSEQVGIEKLFNAPVCVALTVILLIFLSKNKLLSKHGICKAEPMQKGNLYYIPLILISGTNLFLGFKLRYTPFETALGIVTMLCVGFLEETVFRGFLFKALEKNSLRQAVVISSLTFGFSHILSLFLGREFFPTLLQVCYAIALGFLFTILFHQTKSLLPCIVTHSLINSLSIISDADAATPTTELLIALFLCTVSVAYSVYIIKIRKKTAA